MKGVQVVNQSSGETGDEKLHHEKLRGENDHDVFARSPSEISPSSDLPHRDVDFLEDESGEFIYQNSRFFSPK